MIIRRALSGAATLEELRDETQRQFEEVIREILVPGPDVFVVTVTAAYSLQVEDNVVLGDATGGAFNVTLPLAAEATGRIYYVKRTNAAGGNVTVAAQGTETIDGAATDVHAAQWAGNGYVSDGSNWFII